MIYVYRVYHVESGRSYVGVTNCLARRISRHFAIPSVGRPTKLQAAIMRLGAPAFAWEVLYCTECRDEAYRAEFALVLDYAAFAEGFNATLGGMGGSGAVRTAAHREAIAVTKRGKPRPPHVMERLRAANLGRKKTGCELIRLAVARLGWRHSEDTRRKIGLKHRGKDVSLYTRLRLRDNMVTPGRPDFGDVWRGRRQPPDQVSKRVAARRRTLDLNQLGIIGL